MQTSSIRALAEADIPTIIAMLQVDGGYELSNPSSIEQSLRSGRALVYDDGQLKGFVYLDEGRTANQVLMYVAPAWRGQGVGAQLWDAALVALHSSAAPGLVAFYRTDNNPSQSFYQHRGLSPYYAYHLMRYNGPAFPEPPLVWRNYQAEDFELYFPAFCAAFANLMQQVEQKPPAAAEHAIALLQNRENVFLFFDQGQLIGAVTLSDGRLIDDLFTVVGQEGKGYGAQITHFAANRLLEKGLPAELCVVTTNTRAEQLYRRVGFNIVKTLALSRRPSAT